MEIVTSWFQGWNNPETVWLWFLLTAGLTFISAKKMVKFAAGIISKTKLGSLFVGGVLVSVATSIPELITEVSQGLNGTPATGLSDDIGANAFSTFVIAVCTLVFFRQKFLNKLDFWTKLTVIISLVLAIAITIIFYVDKDLTIGKTGKFAIGIIPLGFLLVWIVTTVANYYYDKKHPQTDPEPELKTIEKWLTKVTSRYVVFGFLGASLALVVAAFTLNVSVGGMQGIYGINEKSAGGIFLSMTTAMPEVVSFVFFSIERRPGAAMGSIIGSHIFNLSLIFYGDLAFHNAPILEGPGVGHLWVLSLLVVVEVFFLILAVWVMPRITFARPVPRRIAYAFFPTLIVLSYFIGWFLIISYAN